MQDTNGLTATAAELLLCIQHLTGQPCERPNKDALNAGAALFENGTGIGPSQLNELLLQLGYDRVSVSFFQFLVDGSIDPKPGIPITSLADFRVGVDRFRRLSLLFFGNVKFGFKRLGLSSELNDRHRQASPHEEHNYTNRHAPVLELEAIAYSETYLLGYIVERQLRDRIGRDSSDKKAAELLVRREQVVDMGRRNHDAYLCFDHLDVYVATSMREKHEFALVSKWSTEIFEQEKLKALKLRWFDPTQAYCTDRIDKGLAEALMLKRASCTLYFAQESDTLGKDSELASTLAQGKPVIAYVPKGGADYVNDLLALLQELNPEEEKTSSLIRQLEVFEPNAAWNDAEFRKLLDEEQSAPREQRLYRRLVAATERHYDRRAKILQDDHPLGIQVYLKTGVANGVLVVRDLKTCAELLYRVLLNRLEFEIVEKQIDGKVYYLLQETLSECVFRVMTGDSKLTNSFWNFYLA